MPADIGGRWAGEGLTAGHGALCRGLPVSISSRLYAPRQGAGCGLASCLLLALLCRGTKEWYSAPLANPTDTESPGSIQALHPVLRHPGFYRSQGTACADVGLSPVALGWGALLAAILAAILAGAVVAVRYRRWRSGLSSVNRSPSKVVAFHPDV